MKTLFYSLLVGVVAVGTGWAAGLTDSLSKAQLAELNAGNLVVTSRDVEGGAWPELTVYTRVKAPVSVVKDVFLDYDNAQNYIPNLVSAKVIATPGENIRDVEYTSRLPLLGNSTYSVRNWYSDDAGGTTVKWKLLQSPSADISDGSLRVEAYDGGGAVLRYTNYVKPKSSLAIVAKGAAQSEVRKTVSAIKDESERRAALTR